MKLELKNLKKIRTFENSIKLRRFDEDAKKPEY